MLAVPFSRRLISSNGALATPGNTMDGSWHVNPAAALLALAVLSGPLTWLVGRWRPSLAWQAGALLAGGGLVTTIVAIATGDHAVDVAWAPTWGLRLAFDLDGLARLYALLATGIGLLVVIYAGRYVPLHLHHQGRDQREAGPFFAALLLFMGAMLGLVMARDLVALFVFWDLTALASYLLISYDRHDANARDSALMALLITGISALGLLIAALLLEDRYGTFDLRAMIAAAEDGDHSLGLTIGILILVAALAKSAQLPLHIWLPRAMAAPTPVSAYLHSAAMVAAGVFLIGRFYPLLATEPRLLDGLAVVGAGSMAISGVLATTRADIKQVLAYSTISQYGYVVLMLGLGGHGHYGAVAAMFYVVAHALAKTALFLTAGAVTEATGERRLDRLGGLWRSMPALAAGSGAAAAGLAALPLTVGFFKDELFFAAALERGPAAVAVAVGGATLTIVYIGRFWGGIFLGPPRATARPVPIALVGPVVVLGAAILLTGIIVGPVTRLAEAAAAVSLREAVTVSPAYHLDARPENLMALASFALGGTLLATRGAWAPAAMGLARFGQRFGPARLYRRSLDEFERFSSAMRRVEVRDLRGRVATILFPAGVLVVIALVTTSPQDTFTVGAIGRGDAALVMILLATCGAGIASTLPRDHLSMALTVSGVGYCLAVTYALFGAPDVALVAVLVETMFAVLFLGTLSLLPRRMLAEEAAEPEDHHHGRRDLALAVVAGVIALVVSWSALSRPSFRESVAADYVELAPDAHAKDVVTVILTDFRGLDTMGEITVIGIAMLGIVGLLRRGRLR